MRLSASLMAPSWLLTMAADQLPGQGEGGECVGASLSPHALRSRRVTSAEHSGGRMSAAVRVSMPALSRVLALLQSSPVNLSGLRARCCRTTGIMPSADWRCISSLATQTRGSSLWNAGAVVGWSEAGLQGS